MVRVKRRYALFAIEISGNRAEFMNSEKSLCNALRNSIVDLGGEHAKALAGGKELRVISTYPVQPISTDKINSETESGLMLSSSCFIIVRSARAQIQLVRTAASLTNTLWNQPVAFRTVAVSGTLKSCRKKLLVLFRRRAAIFGASCPMKS